MPEFDGESLWFKLKLTSRGQSEAEPVTLKAICGPGDDAAPVITILLPGEVSECSERPSCRWPR